MNEELRVIITAEIDNLKRELQEGQKEVKDFSSEGKEAFAAFNDEVQKVGDVAKNVLKGVATAIAGAVTAFLALGAATKEYRTAQAKLNAAFEAAGSPTEAANIVYNDLYRVLGDTDTAVEAAQHIAQITTEEKAMAQYTQIAQGVYAMWGDSIEQAGLMEAINHTVELGEVQGPLADALEWVGMSVEDFNARLAECTTEAEREKLIRDTLTGVYGDAAAVYEETAADILAQNEAQERLNEVMAELGEVAQPIVTMLTELGAEILADLTPYIQEFAEKYLPDIKEALSGVGEAIGNVISWIADHWELVSTIAAIVLGIAAALTVFSTIMGIVNAVMMASPITWIVLGIVAAIAALVAGVILVIKYWDEIKEFTIKIWNIIKDFVIEVWTAIKEWVVGKVTELKNKAKEQFDAIKYNVTTIFTNIRDTIKAAIQTAKDVVLSIFDGIKTGIQTRIETVKNVISNIVKLIKAIFTGDFGAAKEAVIGIFDSIKNGIKSRIENARDTVKNVIDKIKGFFDFTWSLPKLKMPHVSITGKFSLSPLEVPKFSISWNEFGGVFDEPTLFGYGNSLQGIGENGAEAVVPLENNLKWLDKLASMLNSRMGSRPIVLQVDGKTFAQVSIDSINALTMQTGSLPLKIV